MLLIRTLAQSALLLALLTAAALWSAEAPPAPPAQPAQPNPPPKAEDSRPEGERQYQTRKYVPPQEEEATGGMSEEGQNQKGGMEALIDSIPLADLEEGVLLQSGEIKISLGAVGKVEAAYVAATRRQQPKFALTPSLQAAVRKSFGFRLLLNAAIEQYAAANKMLLPEEQFAPQFEKFKQGTKEKSASYEQFLADNGFTDEDLRRFLHASWGLEQKFTEAVTADEIAKAMTEFQDSASMRSVSHILFMYKGAERAPAEITRTKEEAKAAAEEVIKKLKDGEDFAKLAEANSDCPSKSKGGDLDFFPRKGAMVESFSAAAYSLEKVGDYTQSPVETPFGFHVIKLTELRSADDVKTATKQRLANEKINSSSSNSAGSRGQSQVQRQAGRGQVARVGHKKAQKTQMLNRSCPPPTPSRKGRGKQQPSLAPSARIVKA